jgi:hypothetical protein
MIKDVIMRDIGLDRTCGQAATAPHFAHDFYTEKAAAG